MVSDTDLPHQPDTLQQSPLIEKKINPIWKIIFILLFIVNIVFVFWAGNELSVRGHTEDLSGLVVIFLSLPLAIIDLIAVLSYVFIHRPFRIMTNV